MNQGHLSQNIDFLINQRAYTIHKWISMNDILMRISTILLSYLTGKENYAILSQLSIVFEILDVIEY